MDGERPRGRFQFHLSTALLVAVAGGAGLGLVIWGIRGQTPLALCALIWLVFAALMVYDALSGPAMKPRAGSKGSVRHG